MKQLTSSEIRKMWLDFFSSKGHKIEPSQSLIPNNDPTLLWINSGVATLKKYFDGSVIPENPRIVNSQKSIRTNDIENVGKTPRHHTLFEMLGNFSIGDYFKKEVIPWAWELLTDPKWFDIEPEKLFVTVYPDDQEAYDLWLSVGVDKSHIIKEEGNFWDIGEGPSGPDTEIFFDRGLEFQNLPDDDPEMYPGGENQRYLEIWNIVFSQYNHLPGLTDNKDYPELPHKNIDTGAGLERITSIFQNAKTNFETDLFLPIIRQTENFSGKKYGQDTQLDISFKVIADHIRAIVFAIGDGALPSNEGRGYVIRRLLRRSVLHGKKLGIEKPFLGQLVPAVGQIMNSYYPELLEQEDKTIKTVLSEEKRFSETLNSGLELFKEVAKKAKENNNNLISGKDAFKLYDTYGFPLELTIEQAEDEHLKVDIEEFNEQMQEQKNRARLARNNSASMGVQNEILVDLKDDSKYIGWRKLESNNSTVEKIIFDNKLVDELAAGNTAQVILSETPFYAEMGGQIADTGWLLNNEGITLARVIDVQNAPNGQHLHTIELEQTIKIGDHVNAKVDSKRHHLISINHTATHMLDQALRLILGNDVHQAGSLVTDEYLRFDFTYQGPVSKDDISKIENLINQEIYKNHPITWVETDIESAKKLGAIAVFGEKYGEVVRVVSIGDFNVEFDGGTHAKSTNELGLFKIISESGIGAGVRRIEAVTALKAIEQYKNQEMQLQKSASLLKAQSTQQVVEKIQTLQNEFKEIQKENESLNAKLANQKSSELLEDIQKIGKTTLTASIVEIPGIDNLRMIADNWKEHGKSEIIILGSSDGNDKANLLVASKNKMVKAGDLIKFIAPEINGGGGGRPDMAQAGGNNPKGLMNAIKKAKEYLINIG
jgi:alanyl-tRNA synthetase